MATSTGAQKRKGDSAVAYIYRLFKRQRYNRARDSLECDLKQTNAFFNIQTPCGTSDIDLEKLKRSADHIREVCTPRASAATPTTTTTPSTNEFPFNPFEGCRSPFTPPEIQQGGYGQANIFNPTDDVFAQHVNVLSDTHRTYMSGDSNNIFTSPVAMYINETAHLTENTNPFQPFLTDSPEYNNNHEQHFLLSETTERNNCEFYMEPPIVNVSGTTVRTRTFNGLQFSMPTPPLALPNRNSVFQVSRKQSFAPTSSLNSTAITTTTTSPFKAVTLRNATQCAPQDYALPQKIPKEVVRIPGFNLHTVGACTQDVHINRANADLLSHVVVCSLGAFRDKYYDFCKDDYAFSMQFLMKRIFEQGMPIHVGIGILDTFNPTHPLSQRPRKSLLTHALCTCAECGYGLQSSKLTNKVKGCATIVFITRRCGHILRYHRRCVRQWYVCDKKHNRLVICPLCKDNTPRGFDEHNMTVPQAKNKLYTGKHLMCFFNPCDTCIASKRMISEDFEDDIIKRLEYFQENLVRRAHNPALPTILDGISPNTLKRKCFLCNTNLSANNFWEQVCCARALTHPGIDPKTLPHSHIRCKTCGPHCCEIKVTPRCHKRCAGQLAWVTECTDKVCGCPYAIWKKVKKTQGSTQKVKKTM